jgi:hypothetical protein
MGEMGSESPDKYNLVLGRRRASASKKDATARVHVNLRYVGTENGRTTT